MRSRFVSSLLLASLFATVLAVSPAHAAGRMLYVSTAGDDDAVGTIDAPWRSLAVAMRRLAPGDTLFVRGGTYREYLGWNVRAGTSTAPIRLVGYPGERVVVMGLLKLVKGHYWHVNRINVTRDPNKPLLQALVKFTDGVGWRYMNSEVWGARGVSNLMVNGTTTGQPRNYRITGNCIHDNDSTGDDWMNYHNIYLYPGYTSGPGLIERNIMFNAEKGNNIKAAGPHSGRGAAYVTIRYNTMARAGQGVVVAYGSHHIKLYRNLITHRRGGSSWYPAIRGYEVSGAGNKAWDNASARYDSVLRSTISKRPIANGGGNRKITVRYNSASDCSGWRPTTSAAKAYGRYA